MQRCALGQGQIWGQGTKCGQNSCPLAQELAQALPKTSSMSCTMSKHELIVQWSGSLLEKTKPKQISKYLLNFPISQVLAA